MSEQLPITYRDFYDVPRAFVTSFRGRSFLFDCPFDDEIDDYPPDYIVYELSSLSDAALAGSWSELPRRAIRVLGRVAVTDVAFDPSRRASVASEPLEALLKGAAARSSDRGVA